MASVKIYAEHRDILDVLITSGKVSSVAGGTKTGPFREQRDAYVFAAAIGLAMQNPTPESRMPKAKKQDTPIRDVVFVGAAGAREVCLTASLLDERDEESLEQSLNRQLKLIAETELAEQFELLDRYAHAGFSWLAKRQEDESSVRDLILAAIDQIERVESAITDTSSVHDPLLDMLDIGDMQL